jgi:hypothetical protein
MRRRWPFCAQSTDLNLGQAHCVALRAWTLDLWLEITKTRKFVIQDFKELSEFITEGHVLPGTAWGGFSPLVKLRLLNPETADFWWAREGPRDQICATLSVYEAEGLQRRTERNGGGIEKFTPSTTPSPKRNQLERSFLFHQLCVFISSWFGTWCTYAKALMSAIVQGKKENKKRTL